MQPLRIRDTAMGLAIFLHWGANFAVSLTFPILPASVGAGVVFLGYAVVAVAALLLRPLPRDGDEGPQPGRDRGRPPGQGRAGLTPEHPQDPLRAYSPALSPGYTPGAFPGLSDSQRSVVLDNSGIAFRAVLQPPLRPQRGVAPVA